MPVVRNRGKSPDKFPSMSVMPAQAGLHGGKMHMLTMGPRLRGNDGWQFGARPFAPITVVRRYILKRIVILAAAAGAILSLYSAAFISGALAQEIKQQIAGVPGEDLPLRLELPAQPDQQGASSTGFIRILGLPPSFSLNRGFAAVGAWAVSLGDAGGLTLATPRDFEGNLLLTVELVRDQSAEPERWRVLVTLAQKQAGASPPPPDVGQYDASFARRLAAAARGQHRKHESRAAATNRKPRADEPRPGSAAT